MRFLVQDEYFECEDIYVKYSPFLSTLCNTLVGSEKEDDAFVIDTTPDIFKQYISYLRGEDFMMNKEIEGFFDLMGHPNKMKYPYDYWCIKLYDNWIRDRFYDLELYKKDPYYGLHKIPILNKLNIHTPSGCFVAGGACLYMAGVVNAYNDIDIFCTDKDKAIEYLLSLKDPLNEDEELYNCISIFRGDNALSWRLKRKKYQLILRLYKSPSEIVHGFDLDCVGIIYDGSYLYATTRTLYALHNRVNWFDPDRASPSYAYRLSKYNIRGFRIGLPFSHKYTIDHEKASLLWDRLCDTARNTTFSFYSSHEDNNPNSRLIIHKSELRTLTDKYKDKKDVPIVDIIKDIYNLCSTGYTVPDPMKLLSRLFESNMFICYGDADAIVQNICDITHEQYQCFDPEDINDQIKERCIATKEYGSITNMIMRSDYDPKDNKRLKLLSFIPKDPVSILLLSTHYNYHTCYWRISDYDGSKMKGEYESRCMSIKETISHIQWKEQDPMTQVTSTFSPEPILNVDKWYRQSPLLKIVQGLEGISLDGSLSETINRCLSYDPKYSVKRSEISNILASYI